MLVAAQVLRDIRSPLATLNTVLRNLPTIPEDQCILIRNSVQRINDVKLNLDIVADAFSLFVAIDSTQFKRVLSNLLNNAIEAIDGAGDVTVRLEKKADLARICLIDTGKEMPPALLDKIKHGRHDTW